MRQKELIALALSVFTSAIATTIWASCALVADEPLSDLKDYDVIFAGIVKGVAASGDFDKRDVRTWPRLIVEGTEPVYPRSMPPVPIEVMYLNGVPCEDRVYTEWTAETLRTTFKGGTKVRFIARSARHTWPTETPNALRLEASIPIRPLPNDDHMKVMGLGFEYDYRSFQYSPRTQSNDAFFLWFELRKDLARLRYAITTADKLHVLERLKWYPVHRMFDLNYPAVLNRNVLDQAEITRLAGERALFLSNNCVRFLGESTCTAMWERGQLTR